VGSVVIFGGGTGNLRRVARVILLFCNLGCTCVQFCFCKVVEVFSKRVHRLRLSSYTFQGEVIEVEQRTEGATLLALIKHTRLTQAVLFNGGSFFVRVRFEAMDPYNMGIFEAFTLKWVESDLILRANRRVKLRFMKSFLQQFSGDKGAAS